MAAGTVTYNTWANRTVGDATVFDVFTLPASGAIRIGDNVLAVELHNVTSLDTVFATSLTARAADPIVITDQPDDATTAVGTAVSFTVAVTGSDPVYRWYKRPNPVILAGTLTYTIVNPTFSRAGDYYVTISNVLGVVTSSVATLTVVPDNFPPGPVSAIAQWLAPSNTIYVTFTENLLTRTATNPACYRLELAGTPNTVVVSNAVPSQNTVTLTVGGPNWQWGSNYILTVTGVSDQRGNRLNGLSNRVAVGFIKQVFPMNGVSKHFDWVEALLLDPTNLALGNFLDTWMMPDSDDSSIHWYNLRGVAYYHLGPPQVVCGSLGDTLGDVADDPSWPRTYYFRTRFNLPPNTGRGSICLLASFYDGAEFYLNGVKIYRSYMDPRPGGIDIVEDPDSVHCVGTGLLEVTNLLCGTNILATEVHQSTDPNTLDVYFGVEIDAIVVPAACPALQIERINTESGGIVVTWPAEQFPGWGLLAQTLGTTNWTLVATHSPFQTNLIPGASQVYRLSAPASAP